jgi:hypothetical protein
MHIKDTPLKPLGSISLNAEEAALLKWMRSAAWEKITIGHDAGYKTKVPEFFGGVRLYRMQAGGASAGSLGALELFIKKLGLQGVISPQGLYPVEGHGNQPRTLTLKKTDLDHLRAVSEDEE